MPKYALLMRCMRENWSEAQRLVDPKAGEGAGADQAAVVILCREKDEHGWLPLHLAARYNQSSEALEELVRAAPGTMNAVNSRGNTPLHETAYEGRVASASKLLSFGPLATDRHPLFFLRARPAHWPPSPLTACVPPPRRR